GSPVGPDAEPPGSARSNSRSQAGIGASTTSLGPTSHVYTVPDTCRLGGASTYPPSPRRAKPGLNSTRFPTRSPGWANQRCSPRPVRERHVLGSIASVESECRPASPSTSSPTAPLSRPVATPTFAVGHSVHQ